MKSLKSQFCIILAACLLSSAAFGAATYTTMRALHIYASLIDSTPIGPNTPALGNFTTLTATGGFAPCSSNTALVGCAVLPGNLLLQWATGSIGSGTCIPNNTGGGASQTVALSFAQTFPTAVMSYSVSTQMASFTTTGDAMWQVQGTPSTSGINVMLQKMDSGSLDGTYTCPTVWAIGN